MAGEKKQQMAECKKVREYTNSRGEIRKIYDMLFEGEDKFEVIETEQFKATVGKFYSPVCGILSVARISKRTGQPYVAYVPMVVAWHEVK
jgi:hypothetical protein